MRQQHPRQHYAQQQQMKQQAVYYLFYDAKQPFTKLCVNKLKALDTKRKLTIASIDGKKSKEVFTGNYTFLRKKKSMIYLENNRVFVQGNALCRLFWTMGGAWRIPGALFVLPGFILSPFYYLLNRLLFWKK